MKLVDAKEGQWLTVVATGSVDVGWQAIRFGIDAGAKIQVQQKISGGPVIVARNELEIAIGRQIAQSIEVTPLCP